MVPAVSSTREALAMTFHKGSEIRRFLFEKGFKCLSIRRVGDERKYRVSLGLEDDKVKRKALVAVLKGTNTVVERARKALVT